MALPISAFLIVTALVYGVALLFIRGKKNRELEVFSGGRRRPLIFGPSTAALAGVIPCSSAARANISIELQRAGYYHRFAFQEFASLRNALVVGWLLFIGALIVVASDPGAGPEFALLLVGLIGALLLYSLPRLILRARASGRARQIEYALPDALDMITMCMTGGLPLQQALARVGTELEATHPDLACELRIVGRQMETGSLDGALQQFAERIDTPDVQSLAAMVGQAGRQGASVAGAFQDFADEVRRARRQRAEEHGNKTTVKMLLPLVFCLAPPIYILLLSPAILELRSFVLQENRAGGILSPGTFSSIEDTAAAAAAMDRIPYQPFSGAAQEDQQPR